jgi:hypothetical protein
VLEAGANRAGDKISCLNCGQKLQIPSPPIPVRPPPNNKTVLAPLVGMPQQWPTEQRDPVGVPDGSAAPNRPMQLPASAIVQPPRQPEEQNFDFDEARNERAPRGGVGLSVTSMIHDSWDLEHVDHGFFFVWRFAWRISYFGLRMLPRRMGCRWCRVRRNIHWRPIWFRRHYFRILRIS